MNENDVGWWNFTLTATDRQGQSTSDLLEVRVRQFPRSRLVNHYFELELSFASRVASVVRNWEWRVLERLSRFLGGGGPGLDPHLLVREVGWPDGSGAGPSLRWTNTSLLGSRSTSCPKEEIREVLEMLARPGSDGEPSTELAQALAPLDVFVRSARVHFLGACLATVSKPPDRKKEDEDSPIPFDGSNRVSFEKFRTCFYDVFFIAGFFLKKIQVPVIRNPLHSLNVSAGELLRFRVPEDTCYDPEDGATPSLSLQLLTVSKRGLSPRSWLKFDEVNQEFSGVPLEEDVGREEYQLVRKNCKKKIVRRK